MKLSALILATLVCFAASSTLKVAVLNDIHYDPYYDDSAGINKFCRNNSPLLEFLGDVLLQASPYGHFGCDSSRKLVEIMLNKMKSIEPDVELILVSGDFIAHGFSVSVGKKPNYDLIKQTIKTVFVDLLSHHFPKAIILPSIGNNDIKYHYKAPTQDDDAIDYYNFFADVLFNQIEGNKKLNLDLSKSVLTNILSNQEHDDKSGLTYPNWAQTFLQNGYYRYDHKFSTAQNDDNLSFISFNSLYYSVNSPSQQKELMKQQLDWLEYHLKNSEINRKFIIYFHIYPGSYQVMSETFFWDDESTRRFTQIVESYSDRILLLLGSHTHFVDFRINLPNPKSTVEKTTKIVMLATASISPVNLNNPGITLMKIDNNEVKDVKFVFLELFMFPQKDSDATFNTLDFNEEYGISTITPKSIQTFIENLEKNSIKFHRYIAHKIGFRGLTELVGAGRFLK